MERINHLDGFDLSLEHDWGYSIEDPYPEATKRTALVKLVICGEVEPGILEDCSHIYVDPDYKGTLSIGQQRLYDVLLGLQQGAVYTITTIGKLCEALDLQVPLACCHRLDNLQSLGAISGWRS